MGRVGAERVGAGRRVSVSHPSLCVGHLYILSAAMPEVPGGAFTAVNTRKPVSLGHDADLRVLEH